MKRSSFVIRLAAGFFFTAVLAYLGIYVYRALVNPFITTPAVLYTVYDSISVNGIVLRDELVLLCDYDIVHITAVDGKRVPVGGEVAAAYLNRQDLNRAVEIRTVQAQIRQLESVQDASKSSADPVKLDAQMRKDILKLKESVLKRDFAVLEDVTAGLRTLAFTGGGSDNDIQQLISELNARLSSLGSADQFISDIIRAPASGLFSRAVDGYERYSPSDARNLDPASLDALLNVQLHMPDNALGKIVCGSRWFFAANIDADDTKKLVDKESAAAKGIEGAEVVDLIFGRYYNQRVKMTVESISHVENGKATVLFSSSAALADTLDLRHQSAEVIEKEYSGLRIPKEALRLNDDGSTCVFVVMGLQAERKDVNIIYEAADYYIVENDPTADNALRPDNSVICSGKDLYNGKVLG